MVNNAQDTPPDIPDEFQGVLMDSDGDGPTVAVETLVIDNNAAASGTAANAGIQHREDYPEGYQLPPIIVS